MVDLDLLRAVVAVWRAGSVSAAARRLHLTQGAVSARLKAAEAAVERPLFVRRPRGMEPTEACEHLVRQSLGPLDAVERAWRDACGREESVVTVHLGGPSDFLAEVALPAIGDGAPVHARFGLPDDLLPALYDGALDLAISTVAPRRAPANVEPIFVETLLWVGYADSWHDAHWLAYHEGLPLISRYAKHTRRTLPTPSLVAPDLRALGGMLRKGVGTTVLPHYLVPRSVPVLEHLDTQVTNTLWLLSGPRRAGFSSVRVVADRLRALQP